MTFIYSFIEICLYYYINTIKIDYLKIKISELNTCMNMHCYLTFIKTVWEVRLYGTVRKIRDRERKRKKKRIMHHIVVYGAQLRTLKTLRHYSNTPTHFQSFPQMYRYKLKVTRIYFVQSVFKAILYTDAKKV